MLRCPYRFPKRDDPGEYEEDERKKWLVILPMHDDESDVAFVIASSLREGRGPVRRFEVVVQPPEGGVLRPTVIDCRWPNTLPQSWFDEAEEMGKLSNETLEEVGKALVYGLRLHELASRSP